jgi:hypothetical protein
MRAVQVRHSESEGENEAKDAKPRRVGTRGKNKSVFAEGQLLAVLAPDHLFELSGTPPPTLRL